MEARHLDELKSRLVEYGRFVEDMIGKSVNAFLEASPALIREIIDVDEARANSLEMEIEERCTSLIAQYEPRGRELRTVLMVLGITTDLERMADHAVNIAETADAARGDAAVAMQTLTRMADATTAMVDDGIRSFTDENPRLAAAVCTRDDTVDELAAAILAETTTAMSAAAAAVNKNLAILKIAGNLERIADLSTNICEDVIYMAEGRVIKHHNAEGQQSP